MLGEAVVNRFGANCRFCFLKYRARRAAALSAHPNKRNSEMGSRKKMRRVSSYMDAAERNYKDPNHVNQLVLP